MPSFFNSRSTRERTTSRYFVRSHAKTIGDWRIDFERLNGDTLSFVRGERSQRLQIVKPVCKFDENDTNIPRHGDDHFAKILLVSRNAAIAEPCDLRHAVNQVRDV